MLLSFDRTATRRYSINALSLLLLGFPLFLDFFPSRNRKLFPCGPVTVDWWWNQQIVGSAEAQVGVMDEWEFRVEIWAVRLPWSSQGRRSSAFRDSQHACCFSSVFLLFLGVVCAFSWSHSCAFACVRVCCHLQRAEWKWSKSAGGLARQSFGEEFQTWPDLFLLHFSEGSRYSCC